MKNAESVLEVLCLMFLGAGLVLEGNEFVNLALVLFSLGIGCFLIHLADKRGRNIFDK